MIVHNSACELYTCTHIKIHIYHRGWKLSGQAMKKHLFWEKSIYSATKSLSDTYSSCPLTFEYLSYSTICQELQNMLQFCIRNNHLTQIGSVLMDTGGVVDRFVFISYNFAIIFMDVWVNAFSWWKDTFFSPYVTFFHDFVVQTV